MKPKVKTLLVALLLSLAQPGIAQLQEAWAIQYTNGASYAHAATVDSNGNVYVTGSSDNDRYRIADASPQRVNIRPRKAAELACGGVPTRRRHDYELRRTSELLLSILR